MSPRPFHASDACVGCGICARSCPTGNITMKGGRPAWSALENRMLACTVGNEMRPWQEALTEFFKNESPEA